MPLGVRPAAGLCWRGVRCDWARCGRTPGSPPARWPRASRPPRLTAEDDARSAVGRGCGRVRCSPCRRSQDARVVLDCPDPRALAEFYRALVGGDITYADDDWVNLRDGGNVLLSFQRAPDYQAPDWPGAEHGQQFHIDVTVGRRRPGRAAGPGPRRPPHRVPARDRRGLELAGLLRPRRPPLLPLLGLTPGIVTRRSPSAGSRQYRR